MSNSLAVYRRLADDFSARVNAVPESAWENPSPCDDWTARQVVAHVVGVHRSFLAALDGSEPPPVDPDDPAPEWASVRAEVEAALADPERAAREVRTPFGAMPYETLVTRIQGVDLLVHTWDLARAVGLDERIDADAVAHAYEGLKPMDGMIRGPGLFKPAIPPPDGADQQTLLLCFLGRSV